MPRSRWAGVRPITADERERTEDLLWTYPSAVGWLARCSDRYRRAEEKATGARIAAYGIDPRIRTNAPSDPTGTGAIGLATFEEATARAAFVVDAIDAFLRWAPKDEATTLCLYYLKHASADSIAYHLRVCRQTVHNIREVALARLWVQWMEDAMQFTVAPAQDAPDGQLWQIVHPAPALTAGAGG